MSYRVTYSHGLTETYDTLDEAIAAVRAVGSVIGHPGDLSDGGLRTLVWSDEELAEGDDGSRAVVEITRLDGSPTPRWR